MKTQNNTNRKKTETPIVCISAIFLAAISLIYVTYFILFPFSVEIFDNLSQNIAMINSKLMLRY
jgi:hypothetical protein